MKTDKDLTSYKVKDGLKYTYCHACGDIKKAPNKDFLCSKCRKKTNKSLELSRSGKKDTPPISSGT